LPIFYRLDTLVRDGHAMSIAGQIIQQIFFSTVEDIPLYTVHIQKERKFPPDFGGT
jgi:hypothetical protein